MTRNPEESENNTQVEESKVKDQSEVGTRGYSLLEKRVVQNLILIFGSRPGVAVVADTKLIRDIMDCLRLLYDKKTKTVRLPEAFDGLVGSDANIEMVTSSMIQTLLLGVEAFKVVRASAYIFVQQFLKRGDLPRLEWKNAEERAKQAEKFFIEMLGVDPARVFILRDKSKAEVVAKYAEIEEEAKQFEVEHEKEPQAINAVFCVWFGF